MARPGKAAGRGKARHGGARLGEAGRGVARHGTARPGMAWQGSARRGMAWHGWAGQGSAWRGKVQNENMELLGDYALDKTICDLDTICSHFVLDGLRRKG